MFGWLKKRRPVALQPEAQWIVAVDAEAIRVTGAAAEMRAVAKAELCGVAIETNDSGPWGADLWWLFFGPDERLACAFPQGATGEEAAIDYVVTLAGFDHAEMIRAMQSTNNATFAVWRRER